MTKKKSTPTKAVEIIAYKGFDANLQCRSFQYKIGETFIHSGKVKACESGFHSCEYPLDICNYYPPAQSRFAVVKASGDISKEENGDSKIASASLTIVAEIGIPELVSRAIEWITSRCTPVDPESPASATGTRGAASATGYQGAASATGDQGAASATGEFSIAVSTGWYGKARAADGCAIVLVHRNGDGELIHIRASKVGDNGIKPDTWYMLSAYGEFVECAE